MVYEMDVQLMVIVGFGLVMALARMIGEVGQRRGEWSPWVLLILEWGRGEAYWREDIDGSTVEEDVKSSTSCINMEVKTRPFVSTCLSLMCGDQRAVQMSVNVRISTEGDTTSIASPQQHDTFIPILVHYNPYKTSTDPSSIYRSTRLYRTKCILRALNPARSPLRTAGNQYHPKKGKENEDLRGEDKVWEVTFHVDQDRGRLVWFPDCERVSQ
jgi:hypothetical protein